jgi:hypothetical protein
MPAVHERKQIRDAVVAALSGHTSAAARVYPSRIRSLANEELPAICVYTDAEQTDEPSANTAPRELKRSMQVAIEAWVSVVANGPVDDAFDAIALEIETAMDADDSLGGTVFWAWPSSTEFGIDNKGARPMGCVKIEYTCVYHSELRTSAQDAARADLKKIDVQYDLNDAQPDVRDRAEDLIVGLDT